MVDPLTQVVQIQRFFDVGYLVKTDIDHELDKLTQTFMRQLVATIQVAVALLIGSRQQPVMLMPFALLQPAWLLRFLDSNAASTLV